MEITGKCAKVKLVDVISNVSGHVLPAMQKFHRKEIRMI